MLRRQPLFTALMPQGVSSGLMPDKHGLQAVLWEAAQNVTFFAGKIKRRVPPALAFSAGANPIRGLSQQQAADGTRWLWAASGGDIRRWYGPSVQDVLLGQTWYLDAGSVTVPTFWDFTHFGDWTIINSGLGAAYIHKPPAAPAVYGDAPTNVVTFRKFKNFVMAIGYGPRGTNVAWSDAGNIEVFTPAKTNLAGSLSIEDLDTRIRAAAPLGSNIAVYAEDQLAIVSYVSAPFYFGERVALHGVGAVGKKAVCADGNTNLGISRAGIWMTDSYSYRYIDEGWLHDYLQENVNWDQAAKCQAIKNDFTGCFEFYFPVRGSTSVNEGWSFDPRTQGWGPLNGHESVDERRMFGYTIVGNADGSVNFDQYDPTASGPLNLVTKPLLMQLQSPTGIENVHFSCKIDEVLLLAKAANNVEFQLQSAAQFDQTVWELSPWLPVTPGSQTTLIPNMPDGTFWKLAFRSTAANWTLDLQGFMLFGYLNGTQRAQQ